MRDILNIMIVDDERIVRSDLKTILNWEEYQYRIAAEAENGIDALAKLEEQEIQLMIVDIEMPKMNGLELAKQVLAGRKSIKIIFLTAHKSFEFVRACMSLGIDSYILKHEIDEKILLTELERMRAELNTSLQKDIFMKNEILRDVLYETESEAEGMKMLQENRIAFRKDDTYLLSILKDSKEDEKEIKKQIVSFAGCVLNNSLVDSYTIFSLEKNMVSVLLVLKEEIRAEERRLTLLTCADKIREELKTTLKTMFFVLISEEIWDIKGFRFIYRKMQEAMKLSWFYQTPCIIFCEAENTEKKLYEEEVNQICGLISERSYEEAQAEIRELFLEKLTEKKDRDYCNQVLVRLTDALAGAWNRENRDKESISSAKLYREAGECINIFEVEKWLSHFLMCMAEIDIEKSKDKINRVCDYVEQHYMEDISLEQLGHVIDVSEAYMSQFFKLQMGVTFKTYLKNLRMEKAKEMLLYSNEKIQDIGKLLGYSSTPYFCLIFKQHFGVTPTEFVRRNQKEHEKK